MNTKASNLQPGTSGADLAKYVLAFAVAAAGIVLFYLVSWPVPVRAIVVVLGFVAAIGILALTALGGRGREFFSESLFELRKVVWPAPAEARKITGIVLLVVLAISLILFAFDFVIQWAIKLLLSN